MGGWFGWLGFFDKEQGLWERERTQEQCRETQFAFLYAQF